MADLDNDSKKNVDQSGKLDKFKKLSEGTALQQMIMLGGNTPEISKDKIESPPEINRTPVLSPSEGVSHTTMSIQSSTWKKLAEMGEYYGLKLNEIIETICYEKD